VHVTEEDRDYGASRFADDPAFRDAVDELRAARTAPWPTHPDGTPLTPDELRERLGIDDADPGELGLPAYPEPGEPPTEAQLLVRRPPDEDEQEDRPGRRG
jgi:hypothetical protein